ncbi:PHB depolymerase family esterase [Flagellimonas sp. DF-77]|uniref:carboxylesterase family protein n=1 Tax=Flagellimonas algarum TaxID=3230298 RepID=UPI003395AD8E
MNVRRYIFILFTALAASCAGQGQLIEGVEDIQLHDELHYYLYYPESYESKTDEEFGLLLFLHGGGESGAALEEIKKNGPPKLLVEGKQFPFLVLAPQNPYKKQWWNIHAVKQLLDHIVSSNRVDTDKIYLTGLSRGGSAAWNLAVQYPETFAALAVVCGMAPAPYAHWLDKDMPIWVFHGDEDPVIPVSESDVMVAKLRGMGFDVRYSRYEGVGHNSWEQAYTNDALYEWMNDQQRDR